MPSKTVKLYTNIPLIGTASKAFFHHNQKAIDEGWAPQLKLVGMWDEEGDGNVYLPLRLVESMENKGFLRVETGPDHDLYQVLMPNSRIRLLKEEDGTKKFITFSLDGTAVPSSLQRPQVSLQVTKPSQEGKDSLKDVVGAVKRFHLGCMALSAHNHVLLYTCGIETLDMVAVHAGAFTVMKGLQEAGVTGFTEKQLANIRDTLSDASYEARKISNQDFPEGDS